jgi:hypothetical protein
MKIILLNFYPAFLIEEVSKQDYYFMMKKARSINVGNLGRMSIRKASDLKKFYKMSYFKKKLKKGKFRFEGGLRYFEMLDFSTNFYSKLKNLGLIFQFNNFSCDTGPNSKLFWCGRVVNLDQSAFSNPGGLTDMATPDGKTSFGFQTKRSAFLDKFGDAEDNDGATNGF